MCGIMGYTGQAQASPLLLEGLSRLEYRGYDSAGMALHFPDQPHLPLQVVKTQGPLQALRDATRNGADLQGTCGIGHTRWATHGTPSAENAHPHLSEDGRIAVVHNGIIENHGELRRKLAAEGVSFRSQTDTEVIAHLLAKACARRPHVPKPLLIASVLQRLTGSYALGLLFAEEPWVIYAVRRGSPLMVGAAEDDGQRSGSVLASDALALLPLTRRVYTPSDDHVIKLTPHSISFYAYDTARANVTDVTEAYGDPVTLTLPETASHRGSSEHFMHKEIREAPAAVKATVAHGARALSSDLFFDPALRTALQSLRLIACGSAYHACLAGKTVIEALCRIPVEVEIASEFRYREPVIPHPALNPAVFVSQSGETADTLAALRLCKTLGMPTLGIVNVQGSSLATEADHLFYTQAGPEVAVATTKAYCAQVAALYLLALSIGEAKGTLSPGAREALLQALTDLTDTMSRLLSSEPTLSALAERLASESHVFFIGRGMDHALALEGSLKLKEVSYIHAEAYPAGELKHGTISLIEEGTPVIALMTQPHLFHKTLSNIAEVKARGAYVICLTAAEEDTELRLALKDTADRVIALPPAPYGLAALGASIPLQLLAYHAALIRSADPDKPRNLAKSVTVE